MRLLKREGKVLFEVRRLDRGLRPGGCGAISGQGGEAAQLLAKGVDPGNLLVDEAGRWRARTAGWSAMRLPGSGSVHEW